MKYSIFSNFVLRTPLLAFNKRDSSLYSLLSKPLIKEAIFLASPVLSTELDKIDPAKISNYNRLSYALNRYLRRMSTRCTPFGLFAGCTLGKADNYTKFVISDIVTRKTRLDMYFLYVLYDYLIRIPDIKYKIKYFPNNTLYRIDKKYRYVEYQSFESGRKYQIAEIERSVYMDKILSVASYYGADISSLTACLEAEAISKSEANQFIEDLINAQILIGELSQSVTGDDFLTQIIKLLEAIDYRDGLLVSLKEIERILMEIDIENNGLERYEKIKRTIEHMYIPFKESHLFQVDMFKEAIDVSLGVNIINEIQVVMDFLNKITPVRNNEMLKNFQQRFSERYEDREVPLLEVLDPDLGIGYSDSYESNNISPLVDDLFLPNKMGVNNEYITPFQSLLFKKVSTCISNNQTEITLGNQDVKDFNSNWDDLPPTIYTMFEIIRSKSDDILIKLNYFGGSCGANLLGRFAYADKSINQFVGDIIQKEQDLISNAILAEIVYLPESRVGNVLYRPHIREYEIPYMTYSAFPSKQLLHLSDLMISIRESRLVIRSKRLDREVVPRLTTAHNFSLSSMPIYRFLCDMQHPIGRRSIAFNWGNLIQKEFNFLPRVRYSNTILSPATWYVSVVEMELLFKIDDDEILIFEVTKFRKGKQMPHCVFMLDGDNELFVDWMNIIDVRSLFSIIKNRSVVVFNEFLFEPENAIAESTSGVYLNECIVAFYKNEK